MKIWSNATDVNKFNQILEQGIVYKVKIIVKDYTGETYASLLDVDLVSESSESNNLKSW